MAMRYFILNKSEVFKNAFSAVENDGIFSLFLRCFVTFKVNLKKSEL